MHVTLVFKVTARRWKACSSIRPTCVLQQVSANYFRTRDIRRMKTCPELHKQPKQRAEKHPPQADPHIPSDPPVFLFIIILVIATLAGILLQVNGVLSEFWMTHVDDWAGTLVGFYILFALRVASQWEKAVVPAPGKIHKTGWTRRLLAHTGIDNVPNWIDQPRDGDPHSIHPRKP